MTTARLLTESEAWEAIADVLEGYGMPPFGKNEHHRCSGLCSVLWVMYFDDMIAADTYTEMSARIRTLKYGTGYLFRPGLVKPRAAFARKWAKETR